MVSSSRTKISDHLTFGIGGFVDHFFVVHSFEDLEEAINFSKNNRLPFFILGAGSNTVFSDDDFHGVVIKLEIKGFEILEDDKCSGDFLVSAFAGEDWDDFVQKTVDLNLWGLENLSFIPGKVGASPVQNIGAYGVEVKDVIDSVLVLDTNSGEQKVFSNKDCQFAYRKSIFKSLKNLVVLKVVYRLSSKEKPNLNYKDINDFFASKNISKPSLKEIREAIINIRKSKLPDYRVVGTAGSFWKNPVVSLEVFQSLKNKYPLIPYFDSGISGFVKIPLAWILDKICNLKGFALGNVSLYERQPLVVIAKKGASFSNLKEFSLKVEEIVFKETGITIEREVEFVS